MYYLRSIVVILFLVLCQISPKGQAYLAFRNTNSNVDSSQSQQLRFRLEGSTFFKNNEYFGDYIEGYTLIGYSLRPTFSFQPNSTIKLSAGAHFLQYGGTDKFDQIVPVLTAHVRFSPSVELLMGNIHGNTHHNLTEVLYDPERIYTRPEETGLQFLFKTKVWEGDLWLDWEQFILKNDTIPEKFTAGLNSKLHLLQKENWRIDIPLQLTATHRGGQISNYEQPMESLANFGFGMVFTGKSNHKWLKEYSLNAIAYTYHDLTDKKERPFSNGFALYPHLTAQNEWIEFLVGYWHGKDFYAPKGTPLFHSISSYKNGFYEQTRKLLNLKLHYHKSFHPSFRFQAGAEGYLDTRSGQLEYVYGIQFIFHPDFKIANIRL